MVVAIVTTCTLEKNEANIWNFEVYYSSLENLLSSLSIDKISVNLALIVPVKYTLRDLI